MASEQEHLVQARHNTQLAQQLAQEMVYPDWVITVSFYAAVHFVEATFAKRFGLHGEIQGVQHAKSPHVWRLNTVKEKLGLDCWKAYKKLYVASKGVRYLEISPEGNRMGLSFYSVEETRDFIQIQLATIRKLLGYAR